MCKCNNKKVNTCGEVVNSTCVKYEGVLPDTSIYYEMCDVTVENTIEELYELVGSGFQPIEYFAGTGLNLNSEVFSVQFGTVSGTVMEGNWRPNWLDVIGRPVIPEQVNIIGGNNITVSGTYPNISISSNQVGDENVIENIVLGTTLAPVISKTVTIPVATNTTLGLVKPGSNLSVSADGTLSANTSNYIAGAGVSINNNIITNTSPNATHTGEVTGSGVLTITNGVVTNPKLSNMPTQTVKANITGGSSVPQDVPISTFATAIGVQSYTAGTGLTLTGNTFSLPVTTVGSGTFVQSVVPTVNGLTVTLGTPSAGTTYPPGTVNALQQGSSNTDMVWSPVTINTWYDNNRIGIATLGNPTPILDGTIRLLAGTNITINQSGNDITFNSTGGGVTYTAGAGINISGSNVITNTAPNATHTGEVTGATALTIANSVVTNAKLANMPAATFKGNTTGGSSAPQDIPISSLAGLIGVTNNLVEVSTSSATLTLNNEIHTAVFIDNDNGSGSVTVDIPSGDFRGQIVSVHLLVDVDNVTLTGDFYEWKTSSGVVNSVVVNMGVGNTIEHIFWSDVRNAWMFKRK